MRARTGGRAVARLHGEKSDSAGSLGIAGGRIKDKLVW